MTTTNTQAKTPLAPGEQRPFPIPGTTAVAYVQLSDAGTVWHVWVEQGGVVPGFDATYDNAAQASAEYRRAIRLFAAHRTAAGIERRRQELAMELATEQHRARRRMHNPTRTAQIETELDALHTLGDRVMLAQLVAHHANRNAA